MGFALMDGSVVVGSRHNGVKIRRLQDDPRCSVNYHNKRTKDELACVTLVGRARIDRDVDRVREYNRLLSAKVYPDAAPDAARRDEMISAMDAAERVLVVLDAVDAVYIQAPPARVHTSGSPSRLISWRAAADPSQ